MTATTRKERFLAAMQESYRMVREHGVRSTRKTRVLHGWVQDELRLTLGDDYSFTGQSPTGSREANVAGMYYGKNVDVHIARDNHTLAVISIKFPISNYWQNSINYFEQQIGETANLRRVNIVYGNLFCVTDPIPYKNRAGEIIRREVIRDHDIQRYARLRADHEHIHAPDEMALGIVTLDTDRDAITAIAAPADLDISDDSRAILSGVLDVDLFFTRMALRIELQHLSP